MQRAAEPYGTELVDLARVRLADLADPAAVASTLDAVMLRLFDPADDEPFTVCAFGSAL